MTDDGTIGDQTDDEKATDNERRVEAANESVGNETGTEAIDETVDEADILLVDEKTNDEMVNE